MEDKKHNVIRPKLSLINIVISSCCNDIRMTEKKTKYITPVTLSVSRLCGLLCILMKEG